MEVELSMLFADVRDSTPLAERTPTQEYKTLIQRFYSAAVAGEILVSEQAAEFAGMQAEGLERRVLELKGISEKVAVRVVKI